MHTRGEKNNHVTKLISLTKLKQTYRVFKCSFVVFLTTFVNAELYVYLNKRGLKV